MKTEPRSNADNAARRKELLDLLDSQNWPDVLRDLLSYTMMTIKNKTWVSVWDGYLPGATEAHDIVMDTIISIIDGVRTARENVPLMAFLKEVIRSKVSHLAEGLENRRTERLPLPGEAIEIDKAPPDIASPEFSPDEVTVTKETESNNARLFALLSQYLSNDPPLQKLLDCNREGYFKREDIALLLGVKVSEVTNMKKRLERRLIDFRREFAAQNPFLEMRK